MGNNESQSTPSQNKPQAGQQSPGQQSPGQQSPGQQKPGAPNQKPRDDNASDKDSQRSAQGGMDTIGNVGRGEDAMDDETDTVSNTAPGISDRN